MKTPIPLSYFRMNILHGMDSWGTHLIRCKKNHIINKLVSQPAQNHGNPVIHSLTMKGILVPWKLWGLSYNIILEASLVHP